jgi:hypothetical protein
MQWCLNNLAGNISNIASAVSAVAGLVAVFFAVCIPRRILVNQLYADLVSEYRSPQMGFAVLSLFAFYHYDCEEKQALIKAKYRERYDAEIARGTDTFAPRRGVAPEATLHFQRRLVAHFYWDLARLYLNTPFQRLSKKQIRQFITPNERKLMSIVLRMSDAAAACFVPCDTVDEPPDDDAAMNQLIKQLYEKSEDLL